MCCLYKVIKCFMLKSLINIVQWTTNRALFVFLSKIKSQKWNKNVNFLPKIISNWIYQESQTLLFNYINYSFIFWFDNSCLYNISTNNSNRTLQEPQIVQSQFKGVLIAYFIIYILSVNKVETKVKYERQTCLNKWPRFV